MYLHKDIFREVNPIIMNEITNRMEHLKNNDFGLERGKLIDYIYTLKNQINVLCSYGFISTGQRRNFLDEATQLMIKVKGTNKKCG